jgi:hypothetical protein
MQVTFREGHRDSYLFLGSDVNYETLSAIVQVSRKHGNDDRLLWDIMKLLHHCSYLALCPERGNDETKAVPDVKWLFETQGRRGGIIVSPSWPIPPKGSEEDNDVQPPHRQAANHHRRVARQIDGTFVVTMEQPSRANPKPVGYEITAFGLALIVAAPLVSAAAASSTPRAGWGPSQAGLRHSTRLSMPQASPIRRAGKSPRSFTGTRPISLPSSNAAGTRSASLLWLIS